MDDHPSLLIKYTKRADADAQTIKSYLYYWFTQKEVDNFYSLLVSFEKVIKVFPESYAVIKPEKQIRRAVLSKQLSVFYKKRKNIITVVAILDNRMDTVKWP